MIKFIKRQLIAPFLVGIGLPDVILKKSAHSRLILNYHGVTDKTYPFINPRHMDVCQFEGHLLFLRKHFSILPLSKMFETNFQAAGKPSVCLTFDDGYANNFEFVLPLLEKYQIPATFFIISKGLVDPDYKTWYDRIDFINLLKPGLISPSDVLKIKKAGIGRDNLVLEKEKDVSQHLKEVYNKYTSYWKLMNAEQLKLLAQNPLVEIGSHTVNHYNLPFLLENEILQELMESRTHLSSVIQKEVLSIAYPEGDYTEHIKNLAEKSGYLYQCAVNYRTPSDPGDHRIRNRFSVSNTTNLASNTLLLARALSSQGF